MDWAPVGREHAQYAGIPRFVYTTKPTSRVRVPRSALVNGVCRLVRVGEALSRLESSMSGRALYNHKVLTPVRITMRNQVDTELVIPERMTRDRPL